MNITLNISSQDYGFVVEAIKLRTIAIVESFEVDKQSAEQAMRAEQLQANNDMKDMVDEMFDQELAKQKTPKKPHWTQTEKGKKIMAARKRKGAK